MRIKARRTSGFSSRRAEFAPAYGPKVASAIGNLQEFALAKFEKAELVEE